MMPPGICACQWASRASRLLADALGDEAPVAPLEHDDDHAPGCPASDLSQGMGLQPAGPPHPALDLVLVGVLSSSSPLPATAPALSLRDELPLPDPLPLY